MVNEMTLQLPPSLVSSDDYQALSMAQQNSLAARLRHCEEVARAGFDVVNTQDSALLEAIDDIELDALSIMSAFSDPEKAVPPYSVHSSWTFECDRQAMAALVVEEAKAFLGASSLHLDMLHADVRNWVRSWARALNLTLRRLATSSSFTEAVVQLIVIDALVASYLAFAATARLNGRLS